MTEVCSLTVDNDRFASVLTVTDEDERNPKCYMPRDSPVGSPSLTTLTTSTSEMTQKMSFSHLSTEGILDTVRQYHLRELVLSYSLLSDQLLKALGDEVSTNFTTLRIEAHLDCKPFPQISPDAWLTFSNKLPHVNLVVLSYMTERDDFTPIIGSYVPVTHLYLGESTPSTVVENIGNYCPRLKELVISAYGPSTLDQALISTARGCPKLSAVALGDCELTCSGFVKFVELCCKRLQILYIWETCLLEDSNFDITGVITKVSTLLGRAWEPEYVPFW